MPYKANIQAKQHYYHKLMEATETAKNGNRSKTQPAEDKPRRARALPSLNAQTSLSSMKKATFSGSVDNSPIDWHMLPLNATFSTADDGSFPMVKVHRSKAVSLSDGKSYSVGSGRCYRVYISAVIPQ